MKHGNGIKDRDVKSSGIEILMTEVFVLNISIPGSTKQTKLTRFLQYFVHQSR
jgi:hypothetical protein